MVEIKSIMARSCLMAGVLAAMRRNGVRSVSAFTTPSIATTPKTTATATRLFASTSQKIVPRVKAVDATEASDGPVVIKGWVRTVRKQKTLAFVEVNDGSNLGGIQCVLPFDQIDDETKEGM